MDKNWLLTISQRAGNFRFVEKPTKGHKTGFRGPSPDVGKATQFKKGQPSANPSGRPKHDLAAEAAKLVFQGMNADAVAKIWRKTMLYNPKMLQVLADRAYGKLKIPIETSTDLDSLTEEQIRERLRILRAKDEGK